MATKLLGNQLRSILNDPVEGFAVELADESDMFEWRVWIEGPRDTAYQNGIFQLSLKFPKDYPMSPPELKFLSDFWHPNVFPTGKVCMSILHPPGEDAMSGELPEERWLPTQSVTTIILSLLSVLNDPNCASPANVDASVEWRNNREAYKARCRKLVDKANRERPAHVVIPHPESDSDQRKRRVQKFHEMNKDLDYEDFYENDADAGADEGEDNESGDENEFLESENEDINTDDEQSPQFPHKEEPVPTKSSEETDSDKSGASEAVVKKEAEEVKPTEEPQETKQQSKGKEKALEDSSDEEFVQSVSASSSSSNAAPVSHPPPERQLSSASATLTDSSISNTHSTNPSSLSNSVSGDSNNNNNDVVPAGKTGKRGKKGKKCVIM